MTTRNIVASLVLALLVVGCSAELPTEALDSSTATDAVAAKASVTKGAVLDAWEGLEDALYLGCLNGGEGEWVDFVGSGRWISNEVITPSGNSLYNGWIEEWDLQLTGQTTGQVWTGTGRGHVAFQVMSDGHTVVSEPLNEVFTSADTSKRLRMLSRFWMNTARGDADISFEVVNCSLVGR